MSGADPVIPLVETAYRPPLAPVDVRCRCGRKLARVILVTGCWIELRCPRCGSYHVVDGREPVVPSNGNGRSIDKTPSSVLG